MIRRSIRAASTREVTAKMDPSQDAAVAARKRYKAAMSGR